MKWCFSLFFLVHLFCASAQNVEGYVPVDQYQLYYQVYGKKGKPVLLINGGPGFSCRYLDEFAERLAKDMKRPVISFDPRGTGHSLVQPISKRTVNLRNQIKDIEALRKHLNINKWDVIGHAYGGAIAMLYAEEYGEHVNKLVLSSSIGMNLDFVDPMLANLNVRLSMAQQEELNDIENARKQGTVTKSKFYKKRFDLLAEVYVYDKTKVEEARNLIQLETDFNLDINQLLWDEMKLYKYDVSKKMKQFENEVLILHGRQDVIGESVPLYSHDIFPNSTLVFFNKAGRYLWIDQPDLYFEHLEGFLN